MKTTSYDSKRRKKERMKYISQKITEMSEGKEIDQIVRKIMRILNSGSLKTE